jgi:hypothetical protein
MPTLKGGYHTADGTKVPSVTTIISKFKESGGLIHWAWKLGTEGKDYREVRDKAADAGTLAHELVEKWINKEPMSIEGPEDVVAKAKNAFGIFLEWAEQTKLTVTDTEVALVSETYRFGGTLDAMLVNGKRSLGDWKTSNSVYADYLYQLAGYAILWEENFPDRPIEGGFHLMRFAKEFPDFAHHYWGELDRAKEGFILMRKLYDIKLELERRVK